MSRPRLLATDLDGTLLRSDGSLSDRTRAAIAAAEGAGVGVVFVTARPPRWLDELADAVGGHGVALCGNGAFVLDVARREVVRAHPFAPTELRELLADLRAAVPGIGFAVECADGMRRDEHFLDAHRDDAVGDDLEAVGAGKLLARADDVEHDVFLDLVSQVVGERAELGFSGARGLAELTPRGVTKASGLRDWCAEQGIAAHDVWACGDMPNDLPMLAWAGRALAVANAHPEVLAAADEVIGGNDDDGVAAVLEGLVEG